MRPSLPAAYTRVVPSTDGRAWDVRDTRPIDRVELMRLLHESRVRRTASELLTGKVVYLP